MTMLQRTVAAACSSRLVTDKGRRILVTGMTHIVISEAVESDIDFRELNRSTRIARLGHAFWLCEALACVLKRRICLNSEQVRSIPTEKLARWIHHYTPKWLRYQGNDFSLLEDIEKAVSCTLKGH